MRGSRCQGVYFNEHLNFELALLPVDLGLRTILPSRRRWPLLQPFYFSFGKYNEIIHVINTEKPFPMLLWFGNYNEIIQIISTVVPFPMLLWFRKCRKYRIILKIRSSETSWYNILGKTLNSHSNLLNIYKLVWNNMGNLGRPLPYEHRLIWK